MSSTEKCDVCLTNESVIEGLCIYCLKRMEPVKENLNILMIYMNTMTEMMIEAGVIDLYEFKQRFQRKLEHDKSINQ
ncbi:hypothetical protein JOC86_002375 [Bacillus pakistanensis]|uniref:Uncharacterized protein n=1 Tax=Rossellomorea pakistanensis TaxID=992288 RepID=A0ABS2NDE5_9BACI|nr:hypothetical protein [Bacillus pakistanensis]MBM7585833.1 hypothetical protein [Bacillus pakistanensis]